MNNSTTITLTNGKQAEVRLVLPGEAYGRSAVNNYDRSLIEFRLGWICAQYFTDTILDRDDHALCLHGGDPDHATVDADTMRFVRRWLTAVMSTSTEHVTTVAPMPTDGITRCDCGSKYWDAYQRHTMIPVSQSDINAGAKDLDFRCHSCDWVYRPAHVTNS